MAIKNGIIACETEALRQVATLKEIAHMWGKSKTGVYLAFQRGDIKGRESFAQRTILIDVNSVRSFWGEPLINTLEVL